MKEEKIKKGLLEFRLEKKKERGALKLHLLYAERGDSVCIGSWIFVWNTVPSTSIRLAKSVSCIVSFFFLLLSFYQFVAFVQNSLVSFSPPLYQLIH